MQLELGLKENTLIARFNGELDHHTAGRTRIMIERAITEKSVKNLIFDFSKLNFMDSSGIGMVIGRYKQIKSLGGQVALICTNEHMNRLVTMSGLTRLISVHKDLNTALKEIKEA